MQILSKLFYRIEDEPFVRPDLEENGTMGGSVAACEAKGENNTHPAWNAFDGSDSTYWYSTSAQQSSYSTWITFYDPTPINLTNVEITHNRTSFYCVKAGAIYGSNDNSEWTKLADISNSDREQFLSIDVNSNGYYKYHKFEATTLQPWNSGDGVYYGWEVREIGITGTYEVNE